MESTEARKARLAAIKVRCVNKVMFRHQFVRCSRMADAGFLCKPCRAARNRRLQEAK
jgi:hypothetical protein